MSAEIVLQDRSLRLRSIVLPDDVPVGIPWYHDPEVLRFSEGEGTPPYDASMVERMWHTMATRCAVYIIEVLAPDGWHAIGDAALCREGGVPIVIGDAAYRSRGLGTRRLRLLVERARSLGWLRLVVKGVYTYNDRARRLHERAGFRLIDRITTEGDPPAWRFELSFTQPVD